MNLLIIFNKIRERVLLFNLECLYSLKNCNRLQLVFLLV
jgi:hypothetical protein